ncbi:glycosyltransferase family 4 protein [Candidatus Alkanophaga liquidiphilum]|nr:Glycosyltransferase involved in cell wall bisynthesis [Candidatus Alkanophaga liquidiphilum]
MKIAMVTTWFPPLVVGSGVRFYEIGKRLSKRHEVHVYTTRCEGVGDLPEGDGELHVHRLRQVKLGRSMEEDYHVLKLRFSLDVLRLVRKEDFDVVDCNVVSKPLVLAAARAGAPLVLTWHEVWGRQNFRLLDPFLAAPAFFMEFILPRLASMNVAVSEIVKRQLTEVLGAGHGRVVVIPNGINPKPFESISVEKQYGRILYVGRLEQHKRVDVLIRAYKRLKRSLPEAELIIVGEGPQSKYLRELSKRLEIDVKFYGFMPRERLVALMKSAWAFVLPSVREGQGIVLLEAMAAGTPPVAVAAKDSGVVDVVRHEYNGLLASESLESLESAIKRLLEDEGLHRRLRAGGQKFVRGYNWDVIAGRVEEIYERVLV